ncbi:HD family phosphohydrolase [Thermovibrio sp.]
MKSMKEDRKTKLLIYGSLLIASLLSTLFILPLNLINLPSLKVGQESPVNVFSPITVTVVNREKTEELKREAKREILPLYNYNQKAQEEAFKEVEKLNFLNEKQKELVKELINSYYKKGIISEVPQGYKEIEVVEGQSREKLKVENLIKESNLRETFKRDLEKLLGNREIAERVSTSIKLKPNLIYSREETERRWKEAESKVKPVVITLKKGELIVRKGEKITPEIEEKLRAIKEAKVKGRGLNKYLSLFLLSLLLYYSVLRMYRILSPSAYEVKNVIFSLSAITLDIFLIKFFTFLSKLIVQSLNLPVESSLIYVPLLSSVIFASMFINKKVAVIHSLPVAFISGFNLSKPFLLTIPLVIGSFFAAFDSRKFKKREVIYRAALKGTGIALTVELLLYYYTFASKFWWNFLIEGFLIGAGALLTAIIVNGLSPLITNLFNFTTDIVYMELINLNHPLLRKLVLKAPGTYSHSVMVATLAEAAAEAIGANALLAKAGGLFHDIGKLKNPQAFIENQMGGVNIHDKLPPEKSAAILRSHVEYGEELGRKYKLPQKVIDIIKQHHGTKLMKYFYHKARELYKDKVDEKTYRYPGPKPQFKESGIIMLADTVEAAVRSMKESGKPLDLEKVIHKLIMDTVEEGQLNQSGLSLKELGIIEKVFKKVLSGIYHNRIEYPEDVKNSKGDSKGN